MPKGVRMTGSWLSAVSAASLLVTLAACAEDEDRGVASSPLITIADEWNSYPAAAMAGTLEEQDGCLLIGGSVVFWPKGTTWDGGSKSVIQTDGSRITVGDEFDGGGGSYDPETDFPDLLGSAEAGQRVVDCVEKAASQDVLIATL